MFDKKKVYKKFFNATTHSNFVIITPITEIYNKLYSNYPVLEETSGWWKQKKIKFENKILTIFKIPQGAAVIDLLNCFDKISVAFYIGYCGGLSNKTSIGQVITVNESYKNEILLKKANIFTVAPEGKKVYQVRTFSEQDKPLIALLKRGGYSAVDMESFDFINCANSKKFHAIPILVVSDLIDKLPFFNAGNREIKKISSAIPTIESQINKQLNSYNIFKVIKVIEDKIIKSRPFNANGNLVSKFIYDQTIISKILARLGNYFYENLNFDEVTSKIINLDKKYLNGFYRLLKDYFLSYNFDKLKFERLELPPYLRNKKEISFFNGDSLDSVVFPKIKGTILIKPNFVSREEFPVTTDIFVLEKIVKKLRKNNSQARVIIADGSSLFFDSTLVFNNKKLHNLAKKYNLRLIDLNKEQIGVLNIKNQVLYIPKILRKVNYLINLSCIKEHNATGVSGPIKNLFGLIAPFQRLSLHRTLNFSAKINSICPLLSPDYTIVDARKIMRKAQQKIYGGYAQKGNGFIYGQDLNKIEYLSRQVLKNEVI